MRNLEDYQRQYEKQPYERHLISYRKRKINEILSRHDHDVILEVGCGLESIFPDVKDFKRFFIAEPALAFYQKALEDVKLNSSRNVSVINKKVEDCENEFKGVPFDFIIISSLLHELPDPEQFMRGFHRIGGPKTVIHVNVSNARSFHRLLAVEMGLIKDEYQKSDRNKQFQQHSVFDLDTLSALVRSAGFEILESGSFSFKPFTHQQMEDMIQAKLITEGMLEGFYRMEKYLPALGSEIFVNVKRHSADE